jgi:hypothetical protein
MRTNPACLLLMLLYASTLFVHAQQVVTTAPDKFFELIREKYRAQAKGFYKKYAEVSGLPIVASGEVADEALARTQWIVGHLLSGRPDVLQAMAKNGMYLIIIGRDQVYTDMPEYSDHPNPAYQNERVRGTGGKPTSFGEENLLSLPLDRYDDESIAVHEFCHTIDGTLRSIDRTWTERRNEVYRKSMEKGLWKNSYAAANPGEFWGEICQSYFDCNRVNNWNHGPVGTREQLKAYDPEAYELVRSTFKLQPEQDWRYTWVRPLPNVAPPPAKFHFDPYYKKFTWGREFPVVSGSASEQALLKANDTVRKMFAYRHDILKALIQDGVKLVVLGKNEHLFDLPEIRGRDIDKLARFLEYTPDLKLIGVSEENILGKPSEPNTGDNQIIRLFAKAAYDICASRPVDPDWDKPSRQPQQYELRVIRIDIRFKEALEKIFQSAQPKGLWKGTPALNSPADYWATGVTAYFDAAGQSQSPENARFPITTRESLREYDPELYNLIAETMAYEHHVDWRYR